MGNFSAVKVITKLSLASSFSKMCIKMNVINVYRIGVALVPTDGVPHLIGQSSKKITVQSKSILVSRKTIQTST